MLHFSVRFARPLRAFKFKESFALLAALAAVPAMSAAELLVLNAAGPRSHIKRFDAATGAEIGAFGQMTEAYYSMTLASPGEVCVSSNTLGEFALERFSVAGALRDSTPTGWMTELLGTTRGPDNRLYAIARHHEENRARIVRLDGPAPGVFIESGTGGLTAPTWMAFGPDGNLYVNDAVLGLLRFSGDVGAPLGVFVPLGRGGLQDVTRHRFGPDGRLYVATAQGAAVLRFDGATGDFVDVFVAAGSGGLNNPRGLAFGVDGHLFVTSQGTHQVLRYDANGAFVGVAAAVAALPGDPRTRLGDIAFVD